jgi:hypothetical protein
MTIDLYPELIHEGDLSPDAVGDEIDEAVEVCNCSACGVLWKVVHKDLNHIVCLSLFCIENCRSLQRLGNRRTVSKEKKKASRCHDD